MSFCGRLILILLEKSIECLSLLRFGFCLLNRLELRQRENRDAGSAL